MANPVFRDDSDEAWSDKRSDESSKIASYTPRTIIVAVSSVKSYHLCTSRIDSKGTFLTPFSASTVNKSK